jgi:AraC family transcriptional regulator
MLRPYELLENVLIEIENKIKENVNADDLADQFYISSVHLQRLFKFAFNWSIGNYIRSRKLAVSLDDLYKPNFNILDIALEYSYEYEKSYIRAFKQEFGTTPGKLRKTGKIVKVTPPLHLFDAKKAENGVLFGPEIVMVPKFYVIGILHRLPSRDLAALTPKMAREFWDKEHTKIKNATDPDNLYIGLVRDYNFGEGVASYLASVPVKNLKNIPQGFSGDTFEASLCARFRYIGKHHYHDLHREIMQPMYTEIYKFRTNEQEKYALLNDKVYIEKIDSRHYDGTYCQMEWFAPVKEKPKK